MTVRLEITVPPVWERIEHVRSAVAACVSLVCPDADRREALAMAATELSENAIKYGHGEHNVVTVTLRSEEGGLSVDVSNVVADSSAYGRVHERIRWIESFPSAEDAFRAALQQVTVPGDGDDGHSGLGLARIAFEAESTLTVEFDGSVLTVRARQAAPASSD